MKIIQISTTVEQGDECNANTITVYGLSDKGYLYVLENKLWVLINKGEIYEIN